MPLKKYKQKRNFKKTPEPGEKSPVKVRAAAGKGLAFVVQEHHASQLHYDFRLENKGVLLSWAVPKGPPIKAKDRRLAVHVEDHPFEYRKFHGTIPAGNYGAGNVKIWDSGTYATVGDGGKGAARAESEKLIAKGMRDGHITFILRGKKLKGEYALIKIRRDITGRGNAWLLVKANK